MYSTDGEGLSTPKLVTGRIKVTAWRASGEQGARYGAALAGAVVGDAGRARGFAGFWLPEWEGGVRVSSSRRFELRIVRCGHSYWVP